jgi:hypothetical protein
MSLSVDFAIQAYNNLDPQGQEEFAHWIAKHHGTPKPKKRTKRKQRDYKPEIKAHIKKLYGIEMP